MDDQDDGADGRLGHLLPAVRPILGLPREERARFAREDRWVEYPAAAKALSAMADVVERPRGIRNRGRLLAGRPDNGKSALLDRLRALNPATSLETGETILPVILMSMPDDPGEAKFWSALLSALRIPHRTTDAAKHHKAQALEVIRVLRSRALLVDEMHNLLEGSGRQQSHALAMLKMVSNELAIPIIAAGTQRAVSALTTDDQTATRFLPIGLPPWRVTQDLRTFLTGMEAVLPLAEPSDLASREMAEALLAKSNETIGGLVFVLQEAAVLAIRGGKERLDLKLVAAVETATLASLNPRNRLDI